MPRNIDGNRSEGGRKTTTNKRKTSTENGADLVAAISGSGEIRTYRIAETTNSRTTALALDDTDSTIRPLGLAVTSGYRPACRPERRFI
jgi:hypothetical protein